MSDIKFFSARYKDCKNDLIHFRNLNRDTARDETYFDWRYLQRPNGLDPIIIWAENGKGEKIGALSLIPHHFMMNNTVAHVGVLGDISVAKSWRGLGIAQQMFGFLSETASARHLRVNLVLPNEAASGPLAKANWRVISTMERYVKFINVEKKLRQVLRAAWLSKLVAFPCNVLLKALSQETYARVVDGYKGMIVTGFDARFDTLWKNAKKDRMSIGVRNKQYLTWRYANHPLINYQIFTLTHHSRLCGYIIFHCFKDTCYMDDVFFLDKNKDPHHLLVFFLKHIRTTDNSRIMLNMNNNDLFELKLSKFGFIKRPSNWNIMVHVDDIKDDAFLLKGNTWFLTAGDKDA